MELKCLKWALFLLYLLIITTEGLQGSALKRGEKKTEVSRTRGSARHGSRFATSTSAPAEPKVEVSSKYAQKPRNHDPTRFSSRKLASKAHNSEVKKADDSSAGSTQGKAYLPEPSADFRRTGRVLKDKDNVQNIEPPKVESRSTGRRGPSRFSRDRSKAKSETKEESSTGPSVFHPHQTENTRSRTGRKIQSNTVLTGRQLKSSVPSSSRYSRVDSSDKSELKPAESVRSNRRSFNTKPDPEDSRQDNSRLRYDIAASGSESVRINIPLNFPVDSESSTSTESSRRSTGSRYKLRGRQEASNDHKPEVEINTASNRGISRRFESTPSSTTTEASSSRGRGRNYASRKSNTVPIETSSTTTAAPDQRRRNFNGKSTPRGFEAPKGQTNKLTEAKAQSLENKRSNRPRGRYRVESSSPNTLVPVSSTVTPAVESEVTATPTQPTVTSTTGKTSRVPLQTVTFVAPSTSDVQITKRQNNFGNRPQQNAGQGRRGSKEDFFNHGLGFRGRRPPGPNDAPTVPLPITTTTAASATTAAPPADTTGRGNPGWTLRRRPGHWQDGNPPGNPGDPTAPVDQERTTTSSPGVATKGGRRGNKTFVKEQGGTGNQQISEDDNYPPDFKARLALLIQQKGAGLTRTPLEEQRLHSSSNVIDTANTDLDLAASDNAYKVVIAQSAYPIEQQASKMSTAELFAARSRVKLENARKLVKPELNIDETSSRPVIVDPTGQSKDDKPTDDSAVDEGQKVFKIARKSSASMIAPPTESAQKITTKSDWKPATKLRKHFKENQQARTSRYKQGNNSYTAKPKSSSSSSSSSLRSTLTKKSNETESEGDKSKQSRATGRYQHQEYKYKFVPKNRGSKLRGPVASHEGVAAVVHEENSIPSTKSPLIEKSRKMFTARKNDKSSVEDIKAVALKLRKTLESMERINQTPRPPRRSDSSEGSTTLLTTMRTVKSFSFSTRLVKDDGEALASSTQKMSEDEPTTLAPTTTQSTSTTSFFVATQQPTTETSSTLSASDDLINEIENSGVSSTTDSTNEVLSAKSTLSPDDDFEPRNAALTNDTGSPVYVVYPSATEKPLSVAITPKVYRYHATVKPDDELLGQPLALQQSVMQEPIISVRVSSGDRSADNSIVVDSNSNIFNPAQSAKILETGNATILEQLRSTVAPLLSTLGAKSPVFQSVYKNTNSANSLPRVTPSGAPPRFSARYRGAELFVRRPTPPTNSLPSNGKDALNIDVSSPGEPKVLTYYQAVETASINNEQTDVRHLWQLGKADQIESPTKNSSNSDLPNVIPITVTNTINDAGPSPGINATTAPTTDTTMITTTKTNDNLEMTQQQPSQTTLKSDEALIMTTGSTTSLMDSPDAADLKLVTPVESTTTNRPTSTSTELITEVSVSIGDRVNSITEFTTSSPTTTSDPKASLILTTTTETVDGFSSESSTDMPTTLPTLIEKSVVTTESIASSSVVSTSTEETTSQMLEKLDYSSTIQPTVSSSPFDVTLPESNNETTITPPAKNEIEPGHSKIAKLQILAQVKAGFMNDVSSTPNSTPEYTTETIEVLESSSNSPMQEITNAPLTIEMSITTSTGTSTTNEAVVETTSANVVDTSSSTTSQTTVQTVEDGHEMVTIQVQSLMSDEENDTTAKNNTLNVKILLYKIMNETVPAGTEKLDLMRDLFSDQNIQSALEKNLLSALNSNEKITSNNLSSSSSFDNRLIAELMKISERVSVNSTGTSESSLNFDKNNMDNSPDGLPQLLGGFLDNTNKTQPVTNDNSTVVDANNETSVVAQMTNMLSATTLSSVIQATNSTNIDTNTDIVTPESFSTTQIDNEILETTTTLSNSVTNPPNFDNNNNNNNNNKVASNLTNELTNLVDSPIMARMLQIFSKLLHAEKSLDNGIPNNAPETHDSNSLTSSDSTEPLPIVDDVTNTVLITDLSTNPESTTLPTEPQTSAGLTTVSPTVIAHFQDTTPATAQRTAGTTFSTPSSIIKSLLSSKSSSSIDNTNHIPTTNPKSSYVPTTATAYLDQSTGYYLPTSPTTAKFSPVIATSFNPAASQPQPPSTTASSRFGSSRLTPAPKFSSSSSTTAPLRDYLIYGIYPNKTIVRKRPEDNLIDPRNVDSPYVIFGIYPDGKLVRKFPNGTVIPDPPSNPVEVVFSLSTTTTTTTTTNRPGLRDNQIINQGMPNQKFDFFFNNRSPVDDGFTQKAFYAPNDVDNALGYSGPTGFDLPIGSVGSDTKDTILPAEGVVVNGNRSNGRIILDRERNEATKTNQDEGQRNSVFIGQDKFVNYWTNGQPNSPPAVLNVNIKSTATAASEGPLSVPGRPLNLDILPNKSIGKSVTAPPGFPWRDPLDQIFGITTTPGTPITASVASNTIDDSTGDNAAISARPINNLVEIFSPVSSTIESLINTPTKATTLPPETTTTTPTAIPVLSSTTDKPLTMNPNAFGTTFDDLAFLNALLEKTASNKGTPKTLTEVEQLLANKILSLALGRPLTNDGPTRSPKAIHPSNASPNSVGGSDDSKFSTPLPTSTASSSLPIVINLHPTTTAKPSTTTAFTWKPIKTFSSYDDFTTPSTSTTSTTVRPTTTTTTSTTTTTTTPATTTTTTTRTTTQRPTTRQPVIITAKPVTTRRPRPRPTTPPPPAGPFAFAVNFFQSLFGRPTTTPRPVVRRPAPTARKVVPTTQRVTTSSYKPTEVASKAPSLSTTFSPEDDAKFLAALLDVARNTNAGDKRSLASSSQQVLNADDEEFLRAILNGEGAKIKPLSTVGGDDQKDAALLAAFLKAQGIEPSTPSSLGKLTSTTTTKTTTTTTTTTLRTTTRRRPPPASTYPPPLFSNFGILSSGSGGGFGSGAGDVASSSGGEGTVRSQVVNAAIGMTRAFGQFIGAAITGAAQSFQSFVKNGTSLWG